MATTPTIGVVLLHMGDRPHQLTEALRLLLFDAVTRERLLANGPAVLARYDWTTAARDTLAVLGAAAEADA